MDTKNFEQYLESQISGYKRERDRIESEVATLQSVLATFREMAKATKQNKFKIGHIVRTLSPTGVMSDSIHKITNMEFFNDEWHYHLYDRFPHATYAESELTSAD